MYQKYGHYLTATWKTFRLIENTFFCFCKKFFIKGGNICPYTLMPDNTVLVRITSNLWTAHNRSTTLHVEQNLSLWFFHNMTKSMLHVWILKHTWEEAPKRFVTSISNKFFRPPIYIENSKSKQEKRSALLTNNKFKIGQKAQVLAMAWLFTFPRTNL